MPFRVAASVLPALLAACSIPAANERLFLLAVRGARPADGQGTDKGSAVSLDGSQDYNHVDFRCSELTWWPGDGLVAAYRASTVPSARYIPAAVARGGSGVNMAAPGLWDFTPGPHAIGKRTQHAALREASRKLIIRTRDDRIFEWETDPSEVASPYDNNHAAWGTETFSSAGCIVVSGTPTEGQWPVFKRRIYSAHEAGQDRFRMLLLPARTLKALLVEPVPIVLAGSRGGRAKTVQEKLIEKGLLEGEADGVFGPHSARALLRYQRKIKDLAADAICGPTTARSLGISW